MLQLIDISLICVGIHVCFQDGMVFGYFGNRMNHWIFKPVAMCLPCMASIWSVLLLQTIDIKAMMIICGLNALFASLIQFFDGKQFPEND
jgi:hypothetical protein